MNTSLVPGSLGALATQSGKSIAETFVNADVVILVDTSGSMSQKDSRDGKSRYDIAVEELSIIQSQMPGKIAVISFSTSVSFDPTGVPVYFGGGTDMAKALQFTKIADIPGMKFILISDGEPDDQQQTLSIAKIYRNPISVIYVGPEDHPTGRNFLQKLASLTGGGSITREKALELAGGIRQLLTAKN